MPRLIERRQKAVAAVAEQFHATLEQAIDSRDAHIIVRSKRIALEVVALDSPISRSGARPPRLRFDRVVLELIRRLRAALEDELTSGQTVVVTVTAPILLPSKTAATLEENIRALLRDRSRQLTDTVHGNQVQIRILRGGRTSRSRLIGFVHNPDSDPSSLFELADSLLQRIGSIKRTRSEFSGDRWLVIANQDESSWIKTYQHVCSELLSQTDFQRVIFVGADGRVCDLAE
jgi:hypothetical protein